MNGLHDKFRHVAAIFALLAAIPVAYLFAPVADGVIAPVVSVRQMRVTRTNTEHGDSIEVVGIIEKHRGWCRIVELYAMGGDPPRMLNLQRGDGGGAPGGHLYSRPEGVQAVGPWTIYPAPPPGTPVTIHAGHDCGMPWLTHTVLLRLDHS